MPARRGSGSRCTAFRRHGRAGFCRFYTSRVFTPPARARGAGVRRRKSPARGLFGGGRNLFLRALVVENDDEENEHHREDNGEAHRISTPPRSMLTHGLVVVAP